MIDRTSRNKLAETLRQYVSGRITNDTLDDLNINNEDYGVQYKGQPLNFHFLDCHDQSLTVTIRHSVLDTESINLNLHINPYFIAIVGYFFVYF